MTKFIVALLLGVSVASQSQLASATERFDLTECSDEVLQLTFDFEDKLTVMAEAALSKSSLGFIQDLLEMVKNPTERDEQGNEVRRLECADFEAKLKSMNKNIAELMVSLANLNASGNVARFVDRLMCSGNNPAIDSEDYCEVSESEEEDIMHLKMPYKYNFQEAIEKYLDPAAPSSSSAEPRAYPSAPDMENLIE